MRLPHSHLEPANLARPLTLLRRPVIPIDNHIDVALLGIPWDGGATERGGARSGPAAVRVASHYRENHGVYDWNPFSIFQISDIGDLPVSPTSLPDTLNIIESSIKAISEKNCSVVAVGGDHLVTLPILRGLQAQGPLGLIHFDAHSDTWDFDFRDYSLTHGTPFRRAIEENLVDPHRMVQVGLRQLLHSKDDFDFLRGIGVAFFTMQDLNEMPLNTIAEEIRRRVGDAPAYLSFDIDCLDPGLAPGTGTPEIGGLTTWQVQSLLHRLIGLNLVGADLVEVSSSSSNSDPTSIIAAGILFELTCLVAAGRLDQVVRSGLYQRSSSRILR